ncbi:MAG TPA: class I SAM-dependent methyltransferase [Candidatus Saccharimonadales bacterium]|nr:class I SAM-dependent methyltransferase [Candidatus Saccharimonadales bacterium]
MSDTNNQTIQAYETHVQEYIDGSPHELTGVVKEWFDTIIAQLPKDARILELGSGFGRDAAYLAAHGFPVLCSDATQAFVDFLQQKGLAARKLNAITDPIDGGPYDMILAYAVLLHFTRDEARQVAQKVRAALKPGGMFALTVKQGEGERWLDDKLGVPRYFCFWQPEPLRQMLYAAGFRDITIASDKATRHATWVQVVARP